MGGSASNEFMVKTDAGEDMCHLRECGYAANLEKASSRLDEVRDGVGLDFPSEFPTPGVRTIDDLANFEGGAAQSRRLDAVYVEGNAEATYYLALLRGIINFTKQTDRHPGTTNARAATAEEIQSLLGANPGSWEQWAQKRKRLSCSRAPLSASSLTLPCAAGAT